MPTVDENVPLEFISTCRPCGQIRLGSNNGIHTNELIGQQLLTGILFDETGDRLTPSHAGSKTRRYRYYVSQRLLQGSKNDQSGWRLPAPRLEKAVVDGICVFLTDEPKLCDAIDAQHRDADEISKAIKAARARAGELKHAGKSARQILHQIASRIEVSSSAQCLTMSRTAVDMPLRHPGSYCVARVGISRNSADTALPIGTTDLESIGSSAAGRACHFSRKMRGRIGADWLQTVRDPEETRSTLRRLIRHASAESFGPCVRWFLGSKKLNNPGREPGISAEPVSEGDWLG